MDLFVVNRYNGDASSSKFLIDPSSSQLEEHNQSEQTLEETPPVKIKKKKFSEVSTSQDEEKNQSQQYGEQTPKIKKKKNENDESICQNEETQLNEEGEVTPKVKKKKKKARGASPCQNEENNQSLQDGEHTPKVKKKKKENDESTCQNEETQLNEEGEETPKVKKKNKKDREILISQNDQSIQEMEETPKVQMKKDSEVIDARSSSKNSEVADNTLSSLSKKKSKKENKDEVPETTTGGSCLELVDDVSSKKKKKRNEGEEDVGKQKRKSQTIDTAEESNQNKVVESVEIDSISNNLESVEVSESSSQKKKKTKSSKVSIDISDIEKQIAPNDSLETVEEKGEKSTTKKKKLVFSPTISKTNNEKETDNKEENESDGIPKQGKKRFRQRARYKNKPKNEDIVKNVEGETKDEEKIEEVEDEEENSNSNDLGGFQVIGNLEFQKRKKVKRVLPEWLAKPTIISVNLKNLNSKIKDLTELDTYFKKLLRKNGVSHFFPVQSELIPYLIKQHSRKSIFWPRDVCVSAPTGSGKTLSFVLPILQLLRDRVVPQIRALVVLPTQDLASQVYSVFKTYVKGTKLQVVLTVGSTPFEEEQKKLVAWDTILQKHVSLADIVVTTPGRLVDHITNSPGFDLSCLKFLVVDEADRMIDNNDCNWLLHINKHINYQGLNSVPPLMLHTFLNYPCRPQRLLFSATLSHDPEKLHQLSLFQPKLFTSIVEGDHPTSESTNTNAMTSGFIGKFTTPAELVEKFTLCTTMTKPLALYHLIKKHAMKGVLCFVNTTQGAHRLAKLLYHIERVTTKAVKNDAQSAKLNIAEVYSDMKLEQRNKIIQDFRRRKIDLVIASDNLARGIDVENIDVVINYEAPDNIKKYIHRIGRTARGGRQGTSVTLVTMHDKNPFLKMLSGVGKQNIEELECTEQELEHLEQVYAKAIERLKKDVEKEGEIILKIAKAQKKGKKIKKNKTLLDGTSKKNKKSNNVPNQIVDSRNEKTNTGNAGIVEPKSGASNGSDKKEKTGDGKAKNTSQKTVKRSEIKKVVKKNMNAEDKKKQFGKKNKNKFNKKKPTVQGQSVNTKGMKRNKKIKLKKLLKKQNKKPKS